MPRAFETCVAGGGRVRTTKPKPGSYLHLCFPKGGGKAVAGEVKKTKKQPAGP
jgi:hypothetical protein